MNGSVMTISLTPTDSDLQQQLSQAMRKMNLPFSQLSNINPASTPGSGSRERVPNRDATGNSSAAGAWDLTIHQRLIDEVSQGIHLTNKDSEDSEDDFTVNRMPKYGIFSK